MKLILLILAAAALAGCTQLDGYDRTYNFQYGDGKQVVSAGVTLHPRSSHYAK